MVPPVNSNGAVYSGETGDALSRPTEMPSPVTQKYPGCVTICPSASFSSSAYRVSVPAVPGISGSVLLPLAVNSAT